MWRERAPAPSFAIRRERDPWALQTSSPLSSSVEVISIVEEPLPEPLPSTDSGDAASREQAVLKLDETIQLYRETMRYPLWSRPADGSNAHLTHWNHSISTGQPFAVDSLKREIQASARIDRVFAAPGQPVSVSTSVSYVEDGRPASADEVGAELQWRDRASETWVTAQAVPLRREGAVWTGSVVPSQVEALRAPIREARILVYTRVGEFEREHSLDFAYAVEQPVIVYGLASDRLVEGSLELGLDVELATAAPVGLQATLFAADGTTAIAVFDDRYFAKSAGRQIIPLRFFGKILHDRGLDGPYVLGAVHGYVYRRDLTPDQLFFDRADAPAMRTAPYFAAAFSASDYESPEVAARIAHYEALRTALRNGQLPPVPPNPPAPARP
jgi:hypothetical protein